MKHYPTLLFCMLLFLTACSPEKSEGQTTLPRSNVGGPCEGCEALLEYGDQRLGPVDTLPNYADSENKMILEGTIYQNDGTTPAEGVIVYIYHTNQEGLYANGADQGWGRRHGKLRGWAKTGADGHYTFFTQRPASYPNTEMPAHIHMTVKEPTTNAYYLDAVEFEDDPFIKEGYHLTQEQRGGSGVITPERVDGIWKAKRDIVLGLNIPEY